MRDVNGFEFVGIKFFDGRDNQVSAQVEPLFGFGVGKADGAVNFKFGDERQGFGGDEFDQFG